MTTKTELFQIPILCKPCLKLKEELKKQNYKKRIFRYHYQKCKECHINNNNNNNDIDFDTKIMLEITDNVKEVSKIIDNYLNCKESNYESEDYNINKINIIYNNCDETLLLENNKINDCIKLYKKCLFFLIK